MRMMRATIGALGILVLSFGLGASPSFAASSDCPAGSFCVWKDVTYSDTRFGVEIANANWDYLGNPSAIRAMNDEDSSTYNRWSTYSATIFVDDSYEGGREICTGVGSYHSGYSDKDDQGSSHKAETGTDKC